MNATIQAQILNADHSVEEVLNVVCTAPGVFLVLAQLDYHFENRYLVGTYDTVSRKLTNEAGNRSAELARAQQIFCETMTNLHEAQFLADFGNQFAASCEAA